MDADGGGAVAVLRHKEPAVTSSKKTSCSGTSNTSRRGALDVCSSISEYVLQLHAAAPFIHPVPCGSFFTAHTTLADLTGSSSSSKKSLPRSSSSSSSIARDLFAAVTQRPAEGDAKAFKTFAKNFHEAATRRLTAAAKSCSVCGAFQQQLDGGNGGDWGICLLPHLIPAKRLKFFPFPEVACGRCLGVMRLSELLAAASANVMGDSPSSGTGGEGALAAVLKHFIELNAHGKGPQGPILYAMAGCSSTNSKGLQQQPAAAAGKRKSIPPMRVSAQAQQRALDVSVAAAFAIELLSKEVPWKLRGPTNTLQQLLACLAQTPSAAAASSTFEATLLRSMKSEPHVGAANRHGKLLRAKQSELCSNCNSREIESLPPGMIEGPNVADGEPLKTVACGDQHRQHQREKKTQKQHTPRACKKLEVA